MASPGGRKSAPVKEQLVREPYRFDFFQAVRLLEHIARERAGAEQGYQRYPVGQDRHPGTEVVRFRALPSRSFPTGAVCSLRPARTDRRRGDPEPADPAAPLDTVESPPPEMVVSFLGITGPTGVLPWHYTQLIIDRLRRRDFALRDFLDLFNHRLISLFYRAWEKYRFPIAYERAARDPQRQEEDLFTGALYCLVGMGTDGLRRRQEYSDEALIYYAGHFSHFPRTAVALEEMLVDYFQLPATVTQFQPQWLYLDPADQSRMPIGGLGRSRNGWNNRLGVDVVVGERVWSVESKIRIRLGPLTYRQFQTFSPTGDGLIPLCQLVRTYIGPELDFDVQPVLLAAEVPWCQLGGDEAGGTRLGWNSWVHAQPMPRDADDTVFAHGGEPVAAGV